MASDFRLLSRPVRLHWAGWETDTFRLQQAGWQLAAEQDMMRYQMHLALRSPNGDAYGMTSGLPMEHVHEWRDGFGPIDLGARLNLGREVRVHTTHLPRFDAIDAVPRMVEGSVTRLEDLCHFAAPLVRTQPIVVPEESVSDLMARILELQQPDRTARIQAALRNPEGFDPRALPEQQFHAQIISFKNAA
jgi:hypothetical protein